MKNFICTITILTIALTVCLAQEAKCAVVYDNMDSSFTTIVKGTDLQKIETWEQPRTEYTPKNLRSQYQIRFSGKDGSNKVTSYTLPVTDYDTYINAISKDEATGKMYVHDNTGRKILTGIDNTAQVKDVQNRVDNLSSRVQAQQNQINKLQNDILTYTQIYMLITEVYNELKTDEKEVFIRSYKDCESRIDIAYFMNYKQVRSVGIKRERICKLLENKLLEAGIK